MDACLICHLQNIFDPFGVYGLGIGAAAAAASFGGMVIGGLLYDPNSEYDREGNPKSYYYPPAPWSRKPPPEEDYVVPTDPETGKPYDGHYYPEYNAHRPPRGMMNGWWNQRESRWEGVYEPHDLFGMRG